MAMAAGLLGAEGDEAPKLSPAQIQELADALEALENEPEERVRRMLHPELPVWAQWLDVPFDENGIPVRHRVAYGGRGASKSRTFATKLILRGAARVERVLCTREFQRSMRDSVHRLLSDEISRLGLGVLGSGFFMVTDKEIRGANGTLFIFQGLHRNANGIKSLEGITIAWVEEAQAVAQSSIDSLIPTIREEGSEIWWSFNPKFPTDPVDKLFRGAKPPPGTILLPVNHEDNPWFPAVLRRDMEYDRGRDPDKYQHIWRGAYLQRSEAKVFRNWRVRPFEAPADAVRRFGADWGFSIDPTVLIDAFIGRWSGEPWESEPVADWEGKVLFVRHEAYEIGCPVDELPSLFAGHDTKSLPGKERWKNDKNREGIPGAHEWKIIADSARPELIAYMAARGFTIEAAVKGPGSLEQGITFLQGFDICVHPECRRTIDELTFYSYEEDKLTGEILPRLADKDNHVIDALRYAMESARKAGSGKMDFASSGARATVAATEGGRTALEEEMQRAITAPNNTPGPGSGWGSSPSHRQGLI